jgi:hypothetical protein
MNRRMTLAPNLASRREFLRRAGIASSALTLSPFFLERMSAVCEAAATRTRVYKVQNGSYITNINKLWEMAEIATKYIGSTDVVVIKGNAQWQNQGYTHTGCIKALIDLILQIPGFSGEVLICDNITNRVAPGQTGFDATTANRANNWSDKNWNELAQDYQAAKKPVATVQWTNDYTNWPSVGSLPSVSAWDPAQGTGWSRSFFSYNGRNMYLSYPVFLSPITPGRMIDMKNGVWENGHYTGRKVKAIFMPTLNNHGNGAEDYAGVTSAVKSFFGATEIHTDDCAVWNGFYHIHSNSFALNDPYCGVKSGDPEAARYAGELVGRYINTMYAPVLYITAAMFAGWQSRVGQAVAANTVLACENPVSLDYIACRDVISPYAAWLNPNQNNNTRKQLLGCNGQGIGTLDPTSIDVYTYDFNHPTTTRLDIERKIRDFKAGKATEQQVKDAIKQYMSGN